MDWLAYRDQLFASQVGLAHRALQALSPCPVLDAETDVLQPRAELRPRLPTACGITSENTLAFGPGTA
jgi:hypothetical protein